MANLDMLKNKIEESGMTIENLAKRANIKRYTLDRRLRGGGEFRASEIVGLTRALKLTVAEKNKIFFS